MDQRETIFTNIRRKMEIPEVIILYKKENFYQNFQKAKKGDNYIQNIEA